MIEEILAALGVPCLRADGYEADDVIATLAEQCRQSARPCWILSGDKDILQLIGGNIRLLAQERGTADMVEYSREKVHELRGIYPEQVVDFLALTGDASDNVPGVPGIGEKTAQKLLAEHGSLDAIYARLEEVTPEGVRRKLAQGRESALLSRELVRLDRSVPGMPGVESLAVGRPADRACRAAVHPRGHEEHRRGAGGPGAVPTASRRPRSLPQPKRRPRRSPPAGRMHP